MKELWETFKVICTVAIFILAVHELMIGVFHDDPTYWMNW